MGSLLDNIHVAHAHQRRGVGSDLLARVAQVVADRPNLGGFYLWVLPAPPEPRHPPPTGTSPSATAIRRHERLGGLIHEYAIAA
jgi:GNAT superfamily N-acetyltransferase